MLNTSQSNLSNSQRFITRPQRSPIIVRDTSVVSNYQAYREIYGNLPFQANNEATTTSRTMTRRNKKNYIFSSNNFHTNYNPFVDSQKVFAKDNRAKNHFENLKKGYRDLAIQVRKGTNAVDNREITIPSNTKNFIPTPKHPFIVSIPEFVRGGGKKIKTASVEIYLTEEDYKIRKRATLADIQKNPYLAGAYLAIKSMSAHMHRGVPYWDNPGEYVAYGYGPGLVKTVETAGTAPGLTLYTKFTAPGKRDSDRNQLNVFQEIFHKVFSYKNYNLLVNRSKRETDVRSLVIEAFMSKIGDQIHDGTITSEAGWNAAMRTVEKNDPNFIKNIKQLMLNAGDERANQINGESDFDRMELDSLQKMITF